MKYDLTVACKSCPFREADARKGETPVRLRSGRITEIHNTVATWHGGEFPCHKTVDHEDAEVEEDDDYRQPGPREQHCAGAIAYAQAAGEVPQAVRMGIAVFNHTPEDYGPADAVFQSFFDWKATALDAEEDEGGGDPCSIVNEGCLAPAGYSDGTVGTEAADDACEECGEPVCSNCIGDDGLCSWCSGADQDEEVA